MNEQPISFDPFFAAEDTTESVAPGCAADAQDEPDPDWRPV